MHPFSTEGEGLVLPGHRHRFGFHRKGRHPHGHGDRIHSWHPHGHHEHHGHGHVHGRPRHFRHHGHRHGGFPVIEPMITQVAPVGSEGGDAFWIRSNTHTGPDCTTVTVDIPGVVKDSVLVWFEKDASDTPVLVVSGIRPMQSFGVDDASRLSQGEGEESDFARFERRFALPVDSAVDVHTVTHQDGVLKVVIPKL